MFDGVGWAAGEIVAFMLIATVIGFFMGWVIGRWLLSGTATGDLEDQVRTLQERVERAEDVASSVREELERSRHELEDERGRVAGLEEEVATARAAATELEARVVASTARGDEVERLAGELEVKSAALGEAQAEAERLAGELEVESAALGQARTETERLAAGLEEAEMAAARASARLAEQEPLLEEAADLRERAAEAVRLEAELVASAAARESLQAYLGRIEAELAETRALLGTAGSVEDALLESPSERPADSVAAEDSIDHVGAPEKLTKKEGVARMADVVARTAGEGPIPDDDLKKVRGIGPKLESTLKDLGITSFRQIANFEPGDIAVVTAALDAFRGRIERDDWMSSAAEQHLKEYGKPA